MSETQAYLVVAGLATTAALLLTDQGIYNTVKEAQFDATWVSKASPVITEFGSTYGLGVLGAFAGYGFIAGDSKAKETVYLASEAFLTAGLWGVTIKLLTGRERPSVESEPGGEWTGPLGYFRRNKDQSFPSFDSFPSGHTLTVFSIATVFAGQYSDNIVVPVVCYTAASLVGISRITEDTHWTSDVFVGAVLGFLTAKEVLANNPSEVSRHASNQEHTHIDWSIGMRYGIPVVHFSMSF
jgi:membrane-associated phospholipid phosphatase